MWFERFRPRYRLLIAADPGSEQDALAEYLEAMFPTTSPFNEAETDPAEDTRIQNLSVRSDTVIP